MLQFLFFLCIFVVFSDVILMYLFPQLIDSACRSVNRHTVNVVYNICMYSMCSLYFVCVLEHVFNSIILAFMKLEKTLLHHKNES